MALSRGDRRPNREMLTNEDPGNFELLLQQFVARFAPLDDVEFGLVEEMASATWRMRRGWLAETELLDQAILRHPVYEPTKMKDERRALAAAFTELSASPALALLHRYETRLSRMYQRALRNLLALRQNNQELTEEVTPRIEEFQANPIPISDTPKPASLQHENQVIAGTQPSAKAKIEPKRPSGGIAA
jgi:hypothetical protein